MTEQPARQLVGVSWVVKRTGLSASSVKRGAADGRIPAYRPLTDWRFDPQEIEDWLAASATQRTTEPAGVQAEPSLVAPAARTHHQRGRATIPAPESTPPLVVIFPDAPWRGLNDQPSPKTARPAGRRRQARATKTVLSR